MSTVVLTAAAPLARVAVLPTRAGAVALEIATIANPRAQPLAIRVAIEIEGAQTRSFELGGATPFPPDRPGRFLLPLPADAAAALAQARGATVIARLVAVREEETLGPEIAVTASAVLASQP